MSSFTVICVPPSVNSVLFPTFHFRLLPNVYFEPLFTCFVVTVPSTPTIVTVHFSTGTCFNVVAPVILISVPPGTISVLSFT